MTTIRFTDAIFLRMQLQRLGRLRKLTQSLGRRDHRRTSALWADLEGLREALEAWIERQDRKFLSRR